MNSNIVPLSILKDKIKKLGLDKYIYKVDYANDGKKKYYVILKDNTNKKIKFGAINYEDTLLREYKKEDKNIIEKRRQNYRQRHKNDNINDMTKPGYWSYWVLW